MLWKNNPSLHTRSHCTDVRASRPEDRLLDNIRLKGESQLLLGSLCVRALSEQSYVDLHVIHWALIKSLLAQTLSELMRRICHGKMQQHVTHIWLRREQDIVLCFLTSVVCTFNLCWWNVFLTEQRRSCWTRSTLLLLYRNVLFPEPSLNASVK